MEIPDFYRSHSAHVAQYTHVFAQAVAARTEVDFDPNLAFVAGLCHDVGKLEISNEIWMKNGKPTNAEWQLIRQHPALGGKLLEGLAPKEVLDCAKYHHERIDGKGYPYNLSGNDIPLIARICSIADCFDAMTSKRPYCKPKTIEQAKMELIHCAGTQFDPWLVDIFCTNVLPSLKKNIHV